VSTFETQHLLDLIHGCWTTQALCAAVELGVVDALATMPLEAAATAQRLGTDRDATARLLQALVSLGICERSHHPRFGLTDMGRLLASDHPQSLRGWTTLVGRQLWAPWQGLADSVRTGLGHHARAGVDRFDALGADASDAATFHLAMSGLTAMVAASVAEVASDWLAGPGRIVDVGASHGGLLAALLARHRERSGIAFDLAHARDLAERTLRQAGLEGRARFVTGSFFDSVPPGHVLLLKSVLHDWDDDRCATLLGNCAAALAPGGVLLLVERLMPATLAQTPEDRRLCRSDLNMLIGPGGRERTGAEFAALLLAAGLAMAQARPLAGGFTLFVAQRKCGSA
jgi:hypothetical protein